MSPRSSSPAVDLPDLVRTLTLVSPALPEAAAAARRLSQQSPWVRARAVSAPTLLVRGREDRLVDVELAPRGRRAFPDARLLVLDGVGHVAQMERPETVARAFLGLVEDLADARRPAAS